MKMSTLFTWLETLLVVFVCASAIALAQIAAPCAELRDSARDARWLHHSLHNGAIPYAACYGGASACADNCSIIKIVNGGTDAVVSIKNKAGVVVLHGYVVRDSTWSFPVHDGVYQVFFYSGTGWNPELPMKGASCKELRGAFVCGGIISKADIVTLESEMMTYELILQDHGNLEVKPSTPGEAL